MFTDLDYVRFVQDSDDKTSIIPPEVRRTFGEGLVEFLENGAGGAWDAPSLEDPDAQARRLHRTLVERLSALYSAYAFDVIQSPIEGMLLGALLWKPAYWAGYPATEALSPSEYLEVGTVAESPKFFITPQAKVGAYKADFLAWFVCGREVQGVAIECDGHDFHEKTKEQATRDKARDRSFLTAGFPVARFSGSEIYRNAAGCVADLHEPLFAALNRVSTDSGWKKS